MNVFITIIAGIFFGLLSSFVAIAAGYNIGDTMYWIVSAPIVFSGSALALWLTN